MTRGIAPRDRDLRPPPPHRRHLPLAVFGYALLAALATWPLVRSPATRVIGHVVREATPPLNTWAMAVVLRGLAHDPSRLFDGNAFYPHRDTLAFSEHMLVSALMAAPVRVFTDNWVLAYNAVTLLTLVLAATGMFLLARTLTGRPAAAFVAGGLYAFHTWNVNEIVRLQILSNEFFPFLLWALIRFFRAPTWRRAAVAALFYGLQSLSCMYWALYAPLLVAVASAFLVWRYRPQVSALVRLAACFVLPGLLLVAVALPYVRSARTLGFERAAPDSVPIDRYLDVLPQNVWYARILGTAGPNQNAAHFLGFAAMALAALALWPRRGLSSTGEIDDGLDGLRPLMVTLVVGAFLLALGPRVLLAGWDLGPGPYAALHRWAPGFRNVRYPERFSVLLMLGFAPLVAAGLRRAIPRVGVAGAAVLGALVLVEHLSIPQFLDAMPGGRDIPEVYRSLATEDDVRVVAEIPASRNRLERFDALPMYYSTAHWKRIVEGFTSYFPPSYNFTKWRLFHFPEAESIAFLQRFGVDTLVVRPEGAALVSGPGPWRVQRVFPDGHRVVRLTVDREAPFSLPAAADPLVEIDRRGWTAQGSTPGGARAIDDDVSTSWATAVRQGKGDFFRVHFPRAETVSRVSVAVRDPYEFPMRLKLIAEDEDGGWTEVPFDEAAAYDRLFATLLHRPQGASLDLDIPPRRLAGFRLRISETDAFAMPWTMAEVRAYGPPREAAPGP